MDRNLFFPTRIFLFLVLVFVTAFSHANGLEVDMEQTGMDYRHIEVSRDLAPAQPARRSAARDFSILEPENDPQRFRIENADIDAVAFFSKYGAVFGLSGDDEMVQTAVSDVVNGFRTIRFRQYHKKLEVIGADYAITELNGRVVSGLGRTARRIRINPKSVITEEEAIAAATRAIKRILPGYLPAQQSLPETGLLITQKQGMKISWVLAFRTTHTGQKIDESFIVDIDAISGAVIHIESLTQQAFVETTATANTLYDGVQQIDVQLDAGTGLYYLRSGVKQLETKSLGGSEYPSAAKDVTSSGAFSGSTAPAANAHWASIKTMDFLRDRYGLNNITNSSKPISVLTDYPKPKAFGKSGGIVLGVEKNGKPITPLDVVAHELGHVVAANFAIPGCCNEPGALTESYSDVLASVIEWHVKGSGAEWKIGDDLVPLVSLISQLPINAYRDIEKPLLTYHPSSATHCNMPPFEPFPGPQNDWGEVHSKSTVPSHAFYQLSEGTGQNATGLKNCLGSPSCSTCNSFTFNVQGIGRFAALDITHRAFLTKLNGLSTFKDARWAQTQSAIELFGEFSQERISVENAWHAVDVGAPYGGSIYTQPANGAQNVHPWPARFEWQIGLGENQWEIQISTHPKFLIGVLSGSTSLYEPHPNLPIGVAIFDDANLKPDTKYYWRVRTSNIDPDRGWRPTQEFTTSTNRATLLAPNLEEDSHPWELNFKWTHIDGAEFYEVQVAFDDQFTQKVISSGKIESTEKVLDVYMGESLFWRVISHGPDEDSVTDNNAASLAQAFNTTTPEVKAISPIDNVQAHPWNLKFEWEYVKGAKKYILETYRDENVTGGDSLELSLENIGQKNTSKVLNYRPVYLSENKTHYWFVRVIGPDPLNEEGVPSDIETWVNNGDLTLVPVSMAPPEMDWEDYSEGAGDVNVKWDHVQHATDYVIELFPLKLDAVDDNDEKLDTKVYARDAIGAQPDADFFLQDLRPLHPQGEAGFNWTIHALGPEGVRGLGQNISNRIFVKADKPKLLSPTTIDIPVPFGEDYVMRYASKFSPTGQYRIQVFDGYGCSGQINAQSVLAGNPGAESTLLLFSPYKNQPYSWRVKAWQGTSYLPFNPWSECRNFKTQRDSENICVQWQKYDENAETDQVVYNVDMEVDSGNFVFLHDAFPNADQFSVFYENKEIYKSQCTPGQTGKLVQIPIDGVSTEIQIVVTPNCNTVSPEYH